MRRSSSTPRRLAETTEVEAADATDAGKALSLLEKIFGKTKFNKDSAGDQFAGWETKDFRASLSVNSKDQDFYFEMDFDYDKDISHHLDAEGLTLEKFEKAFKKEWSLFLKKIDSDLKEMEKKFTDLKEIRKEFSED